MSAPAVRRSLLLTGRSEAARLTGHPLVIAAFIVAAALIWWTSRPPVLVWWASDIAIGSAFLVPAGAVLLAAQRAAGRIRRDRLVPLYESYPVPASVQTAGLLLGVLGPVVLAVAVEAAAALWLDHRGIIGAPQPAVLAGAVLLIALGGAAGVALGTWVPRPVVAILIVVVLGAVELNLALTYGSWVRPVAGTGWLFPWYQPGAVPSFLVGISLPFPWLAHAVELAALTGLAVAAALWRTAARRGAAAVLALGCAVGVAGSGWSQTRPIPATEVSALAAETIHPARFEHCQADGGARYCYFPGFASLVRTWATPVSAVLAGLPAPPRRPLVIRQVTGNQGQLLTGPPFGLPNRAADPAAAAALAAFDGQTDGQGPRPTLASAPSDPPVVQSDDDLVSDDLEESPGLALTTAYWAAGLPTTAPVMRVTGRNGYTLMPVSCEPVGQAREAIAIWLGASAEPGPVLSELGGPQLLRVSGHWIETYYLSGTDVSVIPPATVPGAELARAMLRLPVAQVRDILAARWPGWLSPSATDAQLAAALGLRLPAAPAIPRSLIRYARNDGVVLSWVCP